MHVLTNMTICLCSVLAKALSYLPLPCESKVNNITLAQLIPYMAKKRDTKSCDGQGPVLYQGIMYDFCFADDRECQLKKIQQFELDLHTLLRHACYTSTRVEWVHFKGEQLFFCVPSFSVKAIY